MISLGAQGIPVGGFEPTPLNTGAGAGIASSLGLGHADVGLRPGDPGDTDRPALADFDTSGPPACSGGTASRRSTTASRPARSPRSKFPIIYDQDTGHVLDGLQKRTATGAVLQVRRTSATPTRTSRATSSRRPTRRTCSSSSPSPCWAARQSPRLQLPGLNPSAGLAGVEANRAHDRHRPAQRRRLGLELQGRGDGPRPLDRAAVLGALAAADPALEPRDGGEARRGDRPPRAGRARGRPRHDGRRRRGAAEPRAVRARLHHRDLRHDHDRAAAPQHPRPAAGGQPPDHPRDRPDRGADRARLGDQPLADARVPARHRPAADPRPRRRAAVAHRTELPPAAVEPERPRTSSTASGQHLDNALAVETGQSLKGIDPRIAGLRAVGGPERQPGLSTTTSSSGRWA